MIVAIETCEKQNLLDESGISVSENCGVVDGLITKNKYFNCYENMSGIKKMTVYQRKYHIENTVADICSNYLIELSPNQKQKILKVFDKIKEVIPNINKQRKRMINFKFVLKQLFKMLNYHIISSQYQNQR